jgi:hypothetical protein
MWPGTWDLEFEGQSKECQHCELRQHRKLQNEHGSDRGGDRKDRLRKSEGEVFVCHVRSPLIE